MFTKSCPKCQKEMTYVTKGALKTSLDNNSQCKSCAAKAKNNDANCRFGGLGDKNHFYGKRHTEESKRKIVNNRDQSYSKTDKFKAKMRVISSGKNNPMAGRKVYDIWVEKYGVDEADRLTIEWKSKLSTIFSGAGNPMYGKPTPEKSGNGWSGWYKGWFFRSLRELSYMINVIEKSGHTWTKGELVRIKYKDYKGTDRTYSPDFIVDNKLMVEIKPAKLHSSSNVQLKAVAAIEYCENHNLSYVLLDQSLLTMEEIENLISSKLITLTNKTVEKLESYKKDANGK